MRRYVLLAVAAGLCVGLTACFTTSGKQGKCGKPATCGAAQTEKMSIDQCPVMAKLNLTDEQKVKVQAICDKCCGSKCSKKACKQMTAELEKVLTPEQMAQFKAARAEMKKEGKCGSQPKGSCCKQSEASGCPMKKSD